MSPLKTEPFVPSKLPVSEIQWEPLIPLIGKTNRMLAEYGGALHAVLNPAVLLSPLTTQEAVLSSRIEGTQATLGEVLKFEAGDAPPEESKRNDILEIVNYRKALQIGEKRLKERPFNLNLLKELHAILLDSVRGRNMGRGQFRTTQNWIGVPGSSIEMAEYIPPEPMRLMEFLDDFEKYYHMDTPDPLVQLAVVHAQFEIIHPFMDGNGRIGRILIPLFLFEKGILTGPMFYLSSYIEEHRDEYIVKLHDLGLSPGAWNRWIEFFLLALQEQSKQNAAKAIAIHDLYERLKDRAIDLTHSQYAVRLLDQIFKRPIFQSAHISLGKGQPTRQTVHNLIRLLKEGGMLKVVREGHGRLGHVFALAELVNLCEGKDFL